MAPARLWPSNRCLHRFALQPIQPFPQHPLQHGHTARPVALSFLTIARHRPRLFTRALHIASATAAPAFARLAVAMPPRLFHVHHLAQNAAAYPVAIVIGLSARCHYQLHCSGHGFSFPRLRADRFVQRCAPDCAPSRAWSAARRQSWFTPFPACAACQQAARLATLHVGDFALRSRSSGTGRMSRAHPYPAGFRPRSTRPRPAGLPADPRSGAGRPTRSVPEAGQTKPHPQAPHLAPSTDVTG